MRSQQCLWFCDLLCYHSGDLNWGSTVLLYAKKNNIPILLYPSNCPALHPCPPLKGSSSPMQRCTGVPQASLGQMTDSCPPIAPSSRQSILSALATSSLLKLCSSVTGRKVDRWLAVLLILFAPPIPPTRHHLAVYLQFAGPCPGPYLTWAYLLLLTSPQPLQDSNSILPSPSTPSHPSSCRSVSTLGKSPGCVCLVGPHSALMGVGGCRGHKEGHVSAEPTDKAGAVTGARGGAAVHQACCTQILTIRHIWQVDRGLTDWQLGWWSLVSTLLTLNWP